MKNTIKTIKEGILLVNKPVGISSFGVVARVRRACGIKKVGHAGTLDPMASGLLIVLIGKAWTKKADKFLKFDKTYEAELTLGAISTTADSEGEITQKNAIKPTKQKVINTLAGFIGELEQTPPNYSAIKIGGQRAYKLAREGKEFIMPKRKIVIYNLAKIKYSYPKLSFTVKVSSGTYIRSLAVDIGESLGTGAYLSALRRISIGEFKLSNTITLEEIQKTC